MHPQLRLTQKAWSLLFLEYGALGRVDMLQKLLGKSFDLDICNDDKATVLRYAAECGDLDIINLLLDSSVSTKDIAKGERSPFFLAVKNGHSDVAKRLSSIQDFVIGYPHFWHEIMNKHCSLEQLEILLECKVINFSSLDSRLNDAVSKGDIKLVEILINHGANPNNYDNGRTSLHVASSMWHANVVKFLLTQGVDVHAKNNYGATPLHQASDAGSFHIVAMLLDKGAHINEKDNYGYTPLHYAVSSRASKVVAMLLNKGANSEEKTRDGRTPFYFACRESNIEIMQLLIQRGVNVNEKDNDGNTPLDQQNDQLARINRDYENHWSEHKSVKDAIEFLKQHRDC